MLRFGYEDIFGIKPTWDDLIERLRRYSIASVLDRLSKLSITFDSFPDGARSPEAQKRCCDGLFGTKSPDVWSAFLRNVQEHGAEPDVVGVGLFDELQLINAAKLALVYQVEPPVSESSSAALGEALLMISDLVLGAEPEDSAVDPGSGFPQGDSVLHPPFISVGSEVLTYDQMKDHGLFQCFALETSPFVRKRRD